MLLAVAVAFGSTTFGWIKVSWAVFGLATGDVIERQARRRLANATRIVLSRA